MNFLAFIIAAVSLLPSTDVATDHVDKLHVEHLYDEEGKLIFTQLIAWDWNRDNAHFEVRAWRLLKRVEQRPLRKPDGSYEVVFHDGDTLRRITTPSFEETWTHHDSELGNREHRPKDQRPELSRLLIREAPQKSTSEFIDPQP